MKEQSGKEAFGSDQSEWITKRSGQVWHTVASAIYITKACYMIKGNLLTSLLVDFCFIYYTASFSVDTVSEQNMPSPCVVPKCKGNYKNGPKVHCFSFPKSKYLFDKWKHAIKRENFTPSPLSKVSS